jgi:hypothetical protein
MARAVCLRCGADKGAFDQICPSCGHRPEGEGLLVAWLLSDQSLTGPQLDDAAARIRSGTSIRPTERMLARARAALGRDEARDPGLTRPQRLALLATSLLLTPAVGLVTWAWWRTERPRTAAQALWLSAPAGVAFLVLVGWAWWSAVVG